MPARDSPLAPRLPIAPVAHAGLTPLPPAEPLRAAITAATRCPEPLLLPALVEQARLPPHEAHAAQALALRLARGVRAQSQRAGSRSGLMQGLLHEFALSSREGIALMCLAEALLRIPDAATRDALIRDKLGGGDWQAHLGHSPSLFVNAATWGLLLTGRLVATHSDEGLSGALAHALGRGGEPLIRQGVRVAMRLLGEQFVAGQTIGAALASAGQREAQGFRHSYDMLGEAALTERDAQGYLAAYAHAIQAIGKAANGRGCLDGPGISIKLSALHPCFRRAKTERVQLELYPRLLQLAQRARQQEIGLNIDAEESDRLELSLDLLERLCLEPALARWNGIGFVLQAYQKRGPAVVDFLVDLARRSAHRLMIRLVKGAYWDSEIKRAQIDGLDGYPVYTRRSHTDVAYLACARRLLAASEAVYPQFATHNAQTLAAVYKIASRRHPVFEPGQYEFQCLHGMGEPLYEQVVAAVAQGGLGRPCRIYAPVGTHETLLAYLVRRLLENGANTSFVNRIADAAIPLEALVRDPVAVVEEAARAEGALGLPHPAIPLPRQLYGAQRLNSRGLDLAGEAELEALDGAFGAQSGTSWHAAPLLAVEAVACDAEPVLNPADRRDVVGSVRQPSAEDVDAALAAAREAAPGWANVAPAARAACLEAAADRLEADCERLVPLLVREAGKTCANAVAEVREAVDFLRYYARQIRDNGWDNATHHPLGVVVCISPWNFPLAIFTGQVAAALAAGNAVLAKPAEQTPLVAAVAVRTLLAAGVPRGALQLLPGSGERVGAALVADARVQGVLFTGSTEVARGLQRALARRLAANGQPVPLIAETGGQNAMIVDSSALPEQAVADALHSAFDSAGQRCSALRVLCLQRETAARTIEMLTGAMRELSIGDPRRLATDVGPVIDAEAQDRIERHLDAMRRRGRRVLQPVRPAPEVSRHGTFVAPTLIEIESLAELEHEVFGPVLHVLRYERTALPALLQQINATGYGLTLGLHTRIDETVAQVVQAARVGNLYVNRNVVGAVVGVQPFGGEGLSGTGPKAGGPLYLLRLLSRQPDDAARRAVDSIGIEAALPMRGLDGSAAAPGDEPARTLSDWARAHGFTAAADACEQLRRQSPRSRWRTLRGPTGEADLYAVLPRDAVLCLADNDADRLLQLAAALAVGSRAIWPAAARALWERLPGELREQVSLAQDWQAPHNSFDAVLFAGDDGAALDTAAQLARLPGPIVSLTRWPQTRASVPLARLVAERSLSINTAAAGGNAGLMTVG